MTSALVVDDNKQPADSLCQLLSFLGFDTEVAYGPRAAFLKMKEHTPDILFLDINMPGVDGFEVMAYIKRDPVLHSVPIVVVTADDAPSTIDQARESGAAAVLIKPASLDDLERALRIVGTVPS